MEDEEDTEVVIDLCIADTQMEGTSVVVEEISVSYASAVHLSEQPAAAIGLNDQANNEQGDEASENGHQEQYFDHTQVDDGMYDEDEEEEAGVDNGDMFGATQVDDDYYRRLAESEQLLDVEPTVEEVLLGTPGIGSPQQSANKASNVDDDACAKEEIDDGSESDGNNYVDFCIADTQVPPSRHASVVLLAPRKPSIPSTNSPPSPAGAAVVHHDRHQSHSATMQGHDREPAGLSVYDYLSLSAPISAGEAAKPRSSTSPVQTPIFSALDLVPAESTSMESNAFATAKSGPLTGVSVLPRLCGNLLQAAGSVAEAEVEEPTQLDGSLPHSSASQSVGKSGSSGRDSNPLHPLQRHQGREPSDNSSSSSSFGSFLSGQKSAAPVTTTAAPCNAHAFTTPAPLAPAALLSVAQRTATESGEWITAKRPEPMSGTNNTAYRTAAPVATPHVALVAPAALAKEVLVAASPAVRAVQNMRDISAGESETQLELKSPTLHKDMPTSSTFVGNLEDKSIEELVQMQQRLNQLISSKAQQQQLVSPIKSTGLPLHHHNTANTTANGAATVAVAAKCVSSVPLARQETNYETQASQSQNSNSNAVAGLIMLKNDQSGANAGAGPSGTGGGAVVAGAQPQQQLQPPTSPAVTSATTSASGTPASSVGKRKFYTLTPSAAGTATAAAATVSSASTAAGYVAAGPSSSVAPSPDSATKKHLKRKLAANKLAPVAEEISRVANQFDMSDDDSSDVASPHSNDPEEAPATVKRSKPSPAMVAAPQKAKPQVGFIEPTAPSSANGKNITKKGTESKSGDSNSTSGGGGSKLTTVRRIIIEESQDDCVDDNGADDMDAEFDDASLSVTTSSTSLKSASTAAAKNRAAASTATITATIATAGDTSTGTGSAGAAAPSPAASTSASLLPPDIPESFLKHIPAYFTYLWHALTDKGWFWKRGGGIVSYYYIRPNCQPKKGFVLGTDYFADEEHVIKFVTKLVLEARAKMPPVPAPAPALVPVRERPVSSTSNAAATCAAPARSQIPLSSQLSLCAPLPLVIPDDPIMKDIRKIPWKWLWKILREKGWTWDFGPAHKDFYYAPGYDPKSKNIATLGVHKFDSEDSVRRFIRKQKWPEFANPVSDNVRDSQGGAESQAPDAYLHDPSWKLASHRQKRERREGKGWSDSDSEHSESVAPTSGPAPTTRPSKKSATSSTASASTTAGSKGTSKAATAGKGGKSGGGGQPVGLGRNYSPFKGAQKRHSQQYQHQEFEQATQAQHVSQGSPVRHSRAQNTVAPTSAVTTSSGGSSASSIVNIFEGHRFVVSGIPEKLKAQLMKEIAKRGGVILDSAPLDGNENMYDRVTEEKTGLARIRGPVHVVSHPREFRKPNYLMALATGVDLLHFQWVRDCVERNQFLPVGDYILPTGCCAFSGFNIFPARYTGNGTGSLTISTSAGGSKHAVNRDKMRQAALLPPSTPPTSARPALLLENVKVLNLAGSSWDNVLLATGATAIQNNAPLLQSLTSLHNRGGGAGGSAGGRSRTKHGGGGGRPAHVDLILVDPHEYALSLKESTQVAPAPTSGRYTTPNSLLLSTHTAAGAAGAGAGSSASKIPNSALKIGVAELQAIQKCVEARGGGVNYSGGSVPIVVTTDWLVHCLAVGRLLDYTIVDFFTLPSDPVKRPFTHKMDSVQGTGERYSKYDVVYYTNQRAKSPRISEALSMGRIDSFVRRDEKSPLMVRIRPLVLSTSFQLGPKDTFGGVDPGDGYGHRELTGDPHNAMCLVEVDRLAGKLVLLHKEDFLRVEQYSASDDCVYYASEDWLVENPNVLEVAGAKDDASGAGSEGESEPQMHVQRSQDY